MDEPTNKLSWQSRFARFRLLAIGTSIAAPAFVLFGAAGRFYSVVLYSSFLGYMLGKFFKQDNSNSASLGFFCSVFAGTMYGAYIHPLIHNDYHDLSSIIALVHLAVIAGAVFSFLIWLVGLLRHQ